MLSLRIDFSHQISINCIKVLIVARIYFHLDSLVQFFYVTLSLSVSNFKIVLLLSQVIDILKQLDIFFNDQWLLLFMAFLVFL